MNTVKYTGEQIFTVILKNTSTEVKEQGMDIQSSYLDNHLLYHEQSRSKNEMPDLSFEISLLFYLF